MPTYNDASGVPVLHFGAGDIAIHLARDEGRGGPQDELAFVRSSPHEVGATSDLEGPQDKSTGLLARFVFESVEALDVLISQAQLLRAEMVSAMKGDA